MSTFLLVLEIVLAVFGFCFGVVCSVMSLNRKKPLAFWAKIIASLCFLMIGFLNAFRCSDGIYAVAILAGLFYGFAGDAFLAAPSVLPGRPVVYLSGGVLCFLMGHVLYIAGMIGYAAISVWAFLAAGALLAGVILWTRFRKVDPGPLMIPGLVYMTALCMMAGTAVHVLITRFSTSALLFAIGGLLFVLSDTLLVLHRFGGNRNSLLLHYGVLMTYYPAQSLIALSMFFINS